MRCQLLYGAATCGGKLNRMSLRRYVTMMQRLLPAVLLAWIERGADEDWGAMCYPQLVSGAEAVRALHSAERLDFRAILALNRD